jgi:hypothetical protein
VSGLDAAVGAAHTHAPHSKLEYLLALEHEAHAAATELALAHMASASAAAAAAALAAGASASKSSGEFGDQSSDARCDPSPRTLAGAAPTNSGMANENAADSVLFSTAASHAVVM